MKNLNVPCFLSQNLFLPEQVTKREVRRPFPVNLTCQRDTTSPSEIRLLTIQNRPDKRDQKPGRFSIPHLGIIHLMFHLLENHLDPRVRNTLSQIYNQINPTHSNPDDFAYGCSESPEQTRMIIPWSLTSILTRIRVTTGSTSPFREWAGGAFPAL